ncbi:MAG: pyridoxal phosphate-dependent aminotransferase [Firmicutes bacterium]|nr:pyridoxal phosphate-dependent aminotransferase [Bacillota bacterium]
MINEKMTQRGQNSSVIRELFEFGKQRKAIVGEDKVFDFSIGNPSVPCPKEITECMTRLLTEEDPVALHGYTSAAGDQGTRKAIADYINEKYDLGAEFSDVYMTAGAAASLTISLKSVTQAGEEVIVFTPYFPEYKVFIENAGAKTVEVPVTKSDFQVDFAALENAFSEKTAAVIINSPNNPTGAILTEDTLKKLGMFLSEKEKKYGKEIYLISDEPYRELVYGEIKLAFPAHYYDNTIICYSYSKSLSLPGERIGYILVSPKAASRKILFDTICGSGRSLGFVCAPSLLQKVVAENQGVVSDIAVYEENRRLIYDIITVCGFEAISPDGAFYLFVKSPSGDSNEFSERAKKYELLIVPSDSFGMDGYVRISYCVSKNQIKNSEEAFRKLAKSYGLI